MILISETQQKSVMAMLAWYAGALEQAGLPIERLKDALFPSLMPKGVMGHPLLWLYQELRIDHGAQPITGGALDVMISLGTNMDTILRESAQDIFRRDYGSQWQRGGAVSAQV